MPEPVGLDKVFQEIDEQQRQNQQQREKQRTVSLKQQAAHLLAQLEVDAETDMENKLLIVEATLTAYDREMRNQDMVSLILQKIENRLIEQSSEFKKVISTFETICNAFEDATKFYFEEATAYRKKTDELSSLISSQLQAFKG